MRAALAGFLAAARARYHAREYLPTDPVAIVHEFPDARNQELVALVSAGLAYGRVAQIQQSIRRWLDAFGEDPATVAAAEPAAALAKRLRGWKHRFQTARDLAELCARWGAIAARSSAEAPLGVAVRAETLRDPALPLDAALTGLLRRGRYDSPGFRFLLPAADGAAKRIWLLCRWLVRRADGIDFGLWSWADPARLMIPLDVHVGRVSKWLGLTRRKSPVRATAEEITASLRELEPADPCVFDFTLCRIGMRDLPLPKTPAELLERWNSPGR